MSPSDPSVNVVLTAAQDKIRATAEAAVVEVANGLLMLLMKSAGTYRERGQLAFAQIHILESRELFLSSFAAALRERIDADVAKRSENRVDGRDRLAVDQPGRRRPDRGEDLVRADRPADRPPQRERAARARRLHEQPAAPRLGRSAEEPLRGAVLGSALHKAIEKITDEPDTQKIFGREIGQAMADAMPACYLEIVALVKQRGLKPTDLAMRPADEFSARPVASAASGWHRLRGSAQGLGDVVAGPHRRRSRRAAAQLGALAGRPFRRAAGRQHRSGKLGAAARATDPRRHAGLDRPRPARRARPPPPRPTPS